MLYADVSGSHVWIVVLGGALDIIVIMTECRERAAGGR